MANHIPLPPGSDPIVPDWALLELPNTWADQIDFRRPRDWLRFFRGIMGKQRAKVQVPAELPGLDRIPKYVLQEFHSLPNGNYSKKITRGYISGFDHAMLGTMARGRAKLAEALRQCRSVLDVGCAGGRTAATVKRAGVPEVWGLDPSPYLLQHASTDYPDVRFVQGVAENTGFADQRFDGLAVCFLFHEVPPRYIDQALAEFNRILKPGGLVAICEPSPEQVRTSNWQMLRKYGLRGLYFRWMAGFVFEPFLASWHRMADSTETFARHGFECLSDTTAMPLRHILLRKAA
ncbi:class I SAM-dependent methyltransferase [Proteobacteria bacterium 005FR1]|nr:class I SAM-dependent methyltransferase [Proteobacteria bacterium 005FR1]